MPILPIVLDGTNTMIHKGWLMNWRNKITIKILPPVSVQEVEERSVKEVMADVHDSMVEVLAEVRRNK